MNKMNLVVTHVRLKKAAAIAACTYFQLLLKKISSKQSNTTDIRNCLKDSYSKSLISERVNPITSINLNSKVADRFTSIIALTKQPINPHTRCSRL